MDYYCNPLLSSTPYKCRKKNAPVVVAYVTSWSHILPDPEVVTHINYAFGHINENFNEIGIANEERLRTIVKLKKKNQP
ncbi:hypothetical protein NXY00_16280 [Bacteroides sp. BFG-551]|nr:hypothetical protein [Bacteroides sp. BFG-551]